MKTTLIAGLALGLMTTAAAADSYTVTVTNMLAEELLAPIVITSAANDAHFFTMDYVTPAAETQVLTGDPAEVVASIGEGAFVVHGTDGPPGVLLAPGGEVSIEIETDATALRIFAMVAPTMVPDNYVTNVVDLHGMDMASVELSRFDIGHDEGTMMSSSVDLMGMAAAAVTITRN
jgi:hypothetical protein